MPLWGVTRQNLLLTQAHFCFLHPHGTCTLREAARQQRRGSVAVARREVVAEKVAAAAAAEEAKMAQFRALLAAQQGKMTIPKRN